MDIRDAFFGELYKLAERDSRIVFLTADMDAFLLKKFRQNMPERFFNVGVAEQNAILVATGFAMAGFKPFVYSIIPFITMRCYEQIKIGVCSHNLPVTMVGLGSGLSFGYDGFTHHAMQDIAVMRTLPEISIFNPIDATSMINAVNEIYNMQRPCYIRLDKGEFPEYSPLADDAGMRVLIEPSKTTIFSTGYMTHTMYNVCNKLQRKNIGLVDIYKLKPLGNLLDFLPDTCETIIIAEENAKTGGLWSAVSERISEQNKKVNVIRISFKDAQFLDCGSREWFHKKYEIDENSIIELIKDRNLL